MSMNTSYATRWPLRWRLVLLGLLAAVNLLLPVERGFPPLRILGVPFAINVVVSLFALALVSVAGRNVLVSHLRNPYTVCQALLVAVLVIGAARSNRLSTSLAMALLYFSTFVANYITCHHIVRSEGSQRVAAVLGTVGLVAATVGIIEWTLSEPLWFYEQFADVPSAARIVPGLAYRVWGTLGNPIVYSTALLGTLPFLVRQKRMATMVSVGLCVVAAGATLSRTAILIGAVSALVLLTRVKRARIVVLGGVACFVLLLAASMGQVSSLNEESELVRRITGDDRAATQNIETRLEAMRTLQASLLEGTVLQLLVGNGLRSSGDLVETDIRDSDTMDNTYLTLLYEIGIPGLLLYLVPLLWVLSTPCDRSMRFHKAAVVGWLAAGLSFTSLYYGSCNFPAVVSMAVLTATAGAVDPQRVRVNGLARMAGRSMASIEA